VLTVSCCGQGKQIQKDECRVFSLSSLCEPGHVPFDEENHWLFLLAMSWVLADIMPEQKLRMQSFVYLFAWNNKHIPLGLSTPTIGSWWSQWGIMAASHCHSVWRWQLDSFFSYLCWFDQNWHNSQSIQSIIFEFSMQYNRYLSTWKYELRGNLLLHKENWAV
jgi:hypothetical protein